MGYVGYIYKITNKLNGHAYIGKTVNLKARWRDHKNKRSGTLILSKAFEKYGLESFTFEVLLTITSEDKQLLNQELLALEMIYIEKYNTFKNGYNATLGGEGQTGHPLSKESLQKVSKTRKDRYHKEDYCRWFKGRKKPILQYSLKGEFITEYPSAVDIPNVSSANIIACCKGKLNSAYGYIWKYKTGIIESTIKEATSYHISNKPVLQYTKDQSFLAEYQSATVAANILGISRKSICECLRGRNKTAGGFLWEYKNKEV